MFLTEINCSCIYAQIWQKYSIHFCGEMKTSTILKFCNNIPGIVMKNLGEDFLKFETVFLIWQNKNRHIFFNKKLDRPHKNLNNF